jgi:hypothetical protein
MVVCAELVAGRFETLFGKAGDLFHSDQEAHEPIAGV